MQLYEFISPEFVLKDGELVTFVNPFNYGLLDAVFKDQELKEFCYYSDGSLLCSLLKLKGKRVARISFDFTSIAQSVFENAVKKSQSVALVGGYEGAALGVQEHLRSRFPGIDIRYQSSGFFSDKVSRDDVLQVCSNLDLVVVGMGSPYQEKFLLDLKGIGWMGTGYTCGAFFEQTARSGGEYYPVLLNKLQMRWLYRLWDEPKKMARRYFVAYPKFIWLFLIGKYA